MGFWSWFFFVIGVQGLLALTFESWEQTQWRFDSLFRAVGSFVFWLAYTAFVAHGLVKLF